MQLTAQLIDQLSPPKPAPNGKGTQAFYRDSTIIGFAVRVASGGAKSYILERRIRGKVRRITLGRCQRISFDKARKRAIKLIEEINRENAPRILNGKITDVDISLQEVFTEYLSVHPGLSQNTRADYQRSMQGPLKNWHTIPIRALTEEMVVNRHEAYANKAPARSNNAMRLLHAILNHACLHLISAQHKPIIKSNPVDIINRRDLWYPTRQTKNQTGIDPAQLQHWWQATLQLRKSSSREYLQFLLLTGLPHAIASAVRYEDLDFENGLVSLNMHQNNDVPIQLPIPVHLSQQWHSRISRHAQTGDFLFPGSNREKPIIDPRMAVKQVQRHSGMNFSLTDLHRTFMHIAGMPGLYQPILALIATIYRKKPVILSQKDIELMAEVEEKIYSLCTLSGSKG